MPGVGVKTPLHCGPGEPPCEATPTVLDMCLRPVGQEPPPRSPGTPRTGLACVSGYFKELRRLLTQPWPASAPLGLPATASPQAPCEVKNRARLRTRAPTMPILQSCRQSRAAHARGGDTRPGRTKPAQRA